MNKPNPEQMEKLRVRVAELRGISYNDIWSHALTPPCVRCTVPYYTEDLNACHQAEKALIRSLEHGVRFMDALESVVEPSASFELHVAEAWQRCVAIDRTLSEVPIL